MEDLKKAMAQLDETTKLFNKASKDYKRTEKEADTNLGNIANMANNAADQVTIVQTVGRLKNLIKQAKNGGDINQIVAQMKALNIK